MLTPHDEDGTESEEEEEVYVKDEAKSRQAKTIKYRYCKYCSGTHFVLVERLSLPVCPLLSTFRVSFIGSYYNYRASLC